MKDKIDRIIDEKLFFLKQDELNNIKLEINRIIKSESSKNLDELMALKIKVEALREQLNAQQSKSDVLSNQNAALVDSLNHQKKINNNLNAKIDFLSNELKDKFSSKESQTIAYQLGESIIDTIKNPKSGIRNIPKSSTYLVKESIRRRSKKKNAHKLEKVLGILFDESNTNNKTEVKAERLLNNKFQQTEVNNNSVQAGADKSVEVLRDYIDINKDFKRISYEYGKSHWPKKVKDTRFISVLDEISENSWSEEFKLFRLVKKNFIDQIEASTANGLFIESCWKGNQGEWEYAFTSPGLKHQNAQSLLKALDVAKNKGLPILFWNKEDPMHYEKFLPIAEKCDIIFTTDANKVNDYKEDLKNNNVYSLPFAANPYICNPLNRSRYEEESICFAGSYYSVGHDDRKEQMDRVLPALLKLDGVIYDRMSQLNNERYFFPSIYKSIIRDSVNFKDMTGLYKHFKIFLNVNTITDSPTMMSRRVYELLACGTPVISTPSKAIEEQFPNIVQIATNAQEAERIARNLLDNPWEYARLAHKGYRKVMIKHTYENRKEIVLEALNIEYKASNPLISIILPTMRPYFIDRIVSNIGNQTYSNIECVIITQGYSKNEVDELKLKLDNYENITCKVIENNSAQNLGARLNQALQQANGEFIAKFDDDDLYFPNYLTDMMLPFKFGDWSVVGKKEGFFYLESEDKLIVKYPNQRHIDTDFVMGATLVMRKSDLFEVGGFLEASKGEDSDLLRRMKAAGKKVYAADPFNFVVWRSKDGSSHSWDINADFYKSNCDFVGKGMSADIVIV
ncbi:glycosyltransferase [Psychrobacter sp. Pi2-1]|uniref:glycosyltransferase family protein n=1 Tax=Psychrobacter sp. Pi2-1 TaxID=2774131 RepID=UPI0019188F3C|nr:glycosyltransferase [Psychrobacter sp. Pi2-1]